MLNFTTSSFGVGKMLRRRQSLSLSVLLAECGYYIFKVDPRRQRHRGNMMIVHKDEGSLSAMWLYTRDDVVIVRPWVDGSAFGRLQERLAAKSLNKKISLLKGAILNPRKAEDTWVSWLSEASKREAKAMNLV